MKKAVHVTRYPQLYKGSPDLVGPLYNKKHLRFARSSTHKKRPSDRKAS